MEGVDGGSASAGWLIASRFDPPGSINVYLIPQITPNPAHPGSVTLGIGISRAYATASHLPNPAPGSRPIAQCGGPGAPPGAAQAVRVGRARGAVPAP